MGEKNSNIDGYMPKSISRDGGKTWEVSKTPFPPLTANQRPTVIRLKSGRLFMAGDWQSYDGNQPEAVRAAGLRGAYVAPSEDDGTGVWTQWRPDGSKKRESTCREMKVLSISGKQE